MTNFILPIKQRPNKLNISMFNIMLLKENTVRFYNRLNLFEWLI